MTFNEFYSNIADNEFTGFTAKQRVHMETIDAWVQWHATGGDEPIHPLSAHAYKDIAHMLLQYACEAARVAAEGE